jgi:hypothetical protein
MSSSSNRITPTPPLPLPLWERVGVRGPGPTTPTPTPPAPTTAPLAPPNPGQLRNGNPSGNPNLAPRCGAKARSGCPCRAPAMANGRCRVHGGKSTGPRTPQGKAAMVAAHTKHGNQSAPKRAEQLYVRTVIARNRLKITALELWPYLPPDMAARLAEAPDELWPPIHPSNLPYVKIAESTPWTAGNRTARHTQAAARRAPTAARTRGTARPLPPSLAAERLAARAEAAAQAPWHQAIAFARAAKRAALTAKRAVRAAKRLPPTAALGDPSAPRKATIWPPAPNVPWSELTLLQREVEARKAGLRARANEPHQSAAAPTPLPDTTFPRINPMNRETAAPGPAPMPDTTFPRINPMNRETAATPAPAPLLDATFPRINPMNRETAATPAPAPQPNSASPRINPMNRGAPKPHAPEPHAPECGPVASDTVPAALPNRAARRRWKRLQRHRRAAPAA